MRQRGFTLVEILVVMVMLSLLMLGMVSALHSGAQTESKVDARLERQDRVRTISHFLRQVLGHVVEREWQHPDLPEGERFRGVLAAPDSVQWVGIMPARHGVGGPHFFRLAIEEQDGGPALVLRYQPWSADGQVLAPANSFPTWSVAQVRVLARSVTGFHVRAKGDWPTLAVADGWPQGWQSGWPLRAANPGQLELDITDMDGEWPMLVVALQTSASSTGGDFVIGGRRD